MRSEKRFSGRQPESFNQSADQGIKLAIHGINAFTGGRVIFIIGCDYDGAVWCVPAWDVPSHVLREALDVDWAANVRVWEEFRGI